MNLKKLLLSTAMVTAMIWCGASVAQAQMSNPDRIVYFTFSEPITIPGGTLPAGRYQFKILQSFSDRGILRIDSPDGSKHFGTLLAVPTTRTDPAPSPEVRFLETAANMPPALGSYWLTGTGAGWEFVYPKDQATKLALNTKRPLLSSPMATTANTEQMSASGLTRVSPSGETPYAANSTPTPVSGGAIRGSMDSSDSSVADRAAASSQMAANNTQDQMSGSSTTRSNRKSLPTTAGNSPLAALTGILALATAFGLGVMRRRVA